MLIEKNATVIASDKRGEVARRRRGGFKEERWLNGSAPDYKSVVLGSNPAPPQHMANSVIP
jgi:hypothetical protein